MKQFKMNERQRFSIRKFSIGAASVLLGSVFFVANPATEVQAAEASTEVVAQDGDVKPDNSSSLSASDPSSQNPNVGQAGTEAETQGTEKKEPGTPSKDGEGVAKVEETSTEGNSKLESNKEIAEKQDQPKTDVELSKHLNTQNLESLLSEIAAVKAENYTEESVAALQAKAEEARQVLATAQTQAEIDAAFRTLVSYKNTVLKRVKKNVEPKAPKLDTTNGKATVGLKAENTEPNGTNIAGHNHSLAGTTLPEGSGFRTTPEGSSLKVGAAKGRSDNPIFSNETIIPTDGHPIGNNIRLLAESSSGKGIRSITVKAYDPQANNGQGGFTEAAVKGKLGLTTSGLKGSGSKRWVDLTGDIPSNRFGINNIVVEAEDSSGHKGTTTVRITRPLPQASFTTKKEELNGAANKTDNERPIVSGKIPFPIETNNIPNDADLKAYLVTGGRVDNDRYIPGASDYTTIAVTRVKADGTFTFDPSTYNANTIGTKELKLVVKYARKGTNDTYYEGLESLFSADSLKATVK